MLNKTLKNFRLQNKNDTEANWLKAGENGFTPLSGEFIIYNEDVNYSYKRLKIGDGITKVHELPFISTDVFIEVEELPNENINANVFYRLREEISSTAYPYALSGEDMSEDVKFIVVDELPETGTRVVENSDTAYPQTYYIQKSDLQAYCYIDEELSATEDLSVGWHSPQDATGVSIVVVDDEAKAVDENVLYAILQIEADYSIWTYINKEWKEIKLDYSEFALKDELFSGSWNDLTDKPFGEEGLAPITWDGNKEGYTYVDLGGGYYVRVADYLEVDQVVGGRIASTNKADGSVSIKEIASDNIIMGSDMGFTDEESWADMKLGLFSLRSDENLMGLQFPAGFYIADTEVAYTSKIEFPSQLKQLDEKYIPDTIARVEDIPSDAIIDCEVLPDADINTNAFYRMREEVIGKYDVITNGEKNGITINPDTGEFIPINLYAVDTLPTTGVPFQDLNTMSMNFYFIVEDSTLHLYSDAICSQSMNIPVGWHSAETLDLPYAVVSSPDEATDAGVFYIIPGESSFAYTLYTNNDGAWEAIAPIREVTELSSKGMRDDYIYRLAESIEGYGSGKVKVLETAEDGTTNLVDYTIEDAPVFAYGVPELPQIGTPFMTPIYTNGSVSGVAGFNIYIKTQDMSAWLYGDFLSSNYLGIPQGWSDISVLGETVNIIYSEEEATDTSVKYCLYTPEIRTKYSLYSYNGNGWELLSPKASETESTEIVVDELPDNPIPNTIYNVSGKSLSVNWTVSDNYQLSTDALNNYFNTIIVVDTLGAGSVGSMYYDKSRENIYWYLSSSIGYLPVNWFGGSGIGLIDYVNAADMPENLDPYTVYFVLNNAAGRYKYVNNKWLFLDKIPDDKSNGIISVTELPTTNIDTSAIYRHFISYWYDPTNPETYNYYPRRVVVVDTLPDPKVCTWVDTSDVYSGGYAFVFYQLSDNKFYRTGIKKTDNVQNPYWVEGSNTNVYEYEEDFPANVTGIVFRNNGMYYYEENEWKALSANAEVITKVSELENDAGYITETELNNKGYLTEVPEGYALKSDIPSIEGLATENYVDNKVASLVDSSPETLDTLNELAAALGDDPNFATTVATEIGNKVDKIEGKGLSANDYTTEEKNKLANLAAVATSGSYSDLKDKPAIPTVPTNVGDFTNDVGYLTEQIQSDWNQTDETQADYIKNKPALTSDYIILVDQVNGYEYVIQMHNGNLISFCKCASIEVTTSPNKTEYFEGDTVDLTGIVVSAISQDGLHKEISNYTYSPAVVTSDTDHIDIIYEECGTTYTTSVEISVKSIEDLLVDFEYTPNNDGTYTLTSWKGTLNGESSTELIVPDNDKIIV